MLRLSREEVMAIQFRLRHAIAAAGLAGIVLGGSAAAWAQTDGSSSGPSTTQPSAGAPAPQGHDNANCPNMGSGGPGPQSNGSGYSGT